MTSVTVSLPDDLASQIQAQKQQLSKILELGLRELNASGQAGLGCAADVLEFLATLPTPEEIQNLRASPGLKARVAEMMRKAALARRHPPTKRNRKDTSTLSTSSGWQRQPRD